VGLNVISEPSFFGFGGQTNEEPAVGIVYEPINIGAHFCVAGNFNIRPIHEVTEYNLKSHLLVANRLNQITDFDQLVGRQRPLKQISIEYRYVLLDAFFLDFAVIDPLNLYRIYIINYILLSASGSKKESKQQDTN